LSSIIRTVEDSERLYDLGVEAVSKPRRVDLHGRRGREEGKDGGQERHVDVV
jgi:hypothetical protein